MCLFLFSSRVFEYFSVKCVAQRYIVFYNGENCTHVTHARFEYFSSVVRSTEQKNKTNKKKKNFWSREKKREKCQLEERSKFERNSFDYHRRQILTFKLISDDD
jgi:hypothetical protein